MSTSQAAVELGISPRQLRRTVAAGRIVATKYGTSHAFSPRQLQALERTAHRGRSWTDPACRAALDLLATGEISELIGTERSRLKQRLRNSDVGPLAGQILRGRVSLRRAASPESEKSYVSDLVGELGVSAGGGLAVVIARDADRVVRKARLGLSQRSRGLPVIHKDPFDPTQVASYQSKSRLSLRSKPVRLCCSAALWPSSN